MFGSLELAPTNYYKVPTSIGKVETRLLLVDIYRWTYSTPVSFKRWKNEVILILYSKDKGYCRFRINNQHGFRFGFKNRKRYKHYNAQQSVPTAIGDSQVAECSYD